MNSKGLLYAVVGGCVGAVLAMAVGLFSPLGAQSQSDANFGKITCTGLEVVNTRGDTMVSLSVDKYGGRVSANKKGGIGAAWLRTDEHGGSIDVYGYGGSAWMGTGNSGGGVEVYGEDGRAGMGMDEHGGRVSVIGKDDKGVAWMRINEHGGVVFVFGKDGGMAGMDTYKARASGRVIVYGKDGKPGAGMDTNETGGSISVFGNAAAGAARMIIDEHGGRVEVYGKDDDKPRTIMNVSKDGNGAIGTWDKNGHRLK